MRLLQTNLLLVAVVMLLAPLAVAAEFTLQSVFKALAKNGETTTRFVEQKTIAEFEAPIESTGELSYKAPSRLEKRTVSPDAESLILEDDMLIVERGDFRREIPVTDMPAIGAFVASLRGFVSGDLESVKQAFDLSLSGDSSQWVIKGKPIDPAVSNIVDSIQVDGSEQHLKVFAVALTNGDSSVLTLIK